jgi:hypothetical protein
MTNKTMTVPAEPTPEWVSKFEPIPEYYGVAEDTIRQVIAAAPQQAQEERGWLIEVIGALKTLWLKADGSLTDVASDALRFCREKDAEGFLQVLLSAKFGDDTVAVYKRRLSTESYVVTEHIWYAAMPATQQAPISKNPYSAADSGAYGSEYQGQQAQAGEAVALMCDRLRSMGLGTCNEAADLLERTAALQPQPQAVDEREKYEKWAKPDRMQARRDEEGNYVDCGMSAGWTAWQARASLSAQPAPVAPVAPVAAEQQDLAVAHTQRGFALVEFTDRYDVKCSLQASSLATEAAIWFGCNEANPRAMVPGEGWKPVAMPADYVADTRMHLTQEKVRELLPVLQHFAETGEVAHPIASSRDEQGERDAVIEMCAKVCEKTRMAWGSSFAADIRALKTVKAGEQDPQRMSADDRRSASDAVMAVEQQADAGGEPLGTVCVYGSGQCYDIVTTGNQRQRILAMDGEPVYARPPAPAQQVLTDERIVEFARAAGIIFDPAGPEDDGIDTWYGKQYLPSGSLIKLARAIESALSAQSVSGEKGGAK